jgi:4-hydroxythreonine-4-phosphate dehydrogenase
LLPLISISLGDPAGIGPEVTIKALADTSLRASARWVICGNRAPIAHAANITLPIRIASLHDTPPTDGEVVLLPEDRWENTTTFTPNTAVSGAASLAYVHRAITLARDTTLPQAWRAQAIATAPISKEAWFAAGETRYPGHTELFAESFGASNYAMMFAAQPQGDKPGIHCVLTTAHMPLREVASTLTTQRILDVITLGHRAMLRLGNARPRIGVCGLNPHAGEHGILGHEDDAIIKPAVDAARAAGIKVSGPLSADTIFQGALAYETKPPLNFDLIVAMYHDQGLIPVKLLAWDRAVNMTVGLMHDGKPILRTSPDHGTAFNIAGKGFADAGSMAAALRMAVQSAIASR